MKRDCKLIVVSMQILFVFVLVISVFGCSQSAGIAQPMERIDNNKLPKITEFFYTTRAAQLAEMENAKQSGFGLLDRDKYMDIWIIHKIIPCETHEKRISSLFHIIPPCQDKTHWAIGANSNFVVVHDLRDLLRVKFAQNPHKEWSKLSTLSIRLLVDYGAAWELVHGVLKLCAEMGFCNILLVTREGNGTHDIFSAWIPPVFNSLGNILSVTMGEAKEGATLRINIPYKIDGTIVSADIYWNNEKGKSIFTVDGTKYKNEAWNALAPGGFREFKDTNFTCQLYYRFPYSGNEQPTSYLKINATGNTPWDIVSDVIDTVPRPAYKMLLFSNEVLSE
ncbi:MAG: hypothetical protein WC980_00030 [Candidatus Brocadiia bacterium]